MLAHSGIQNQYGLSIAFVKGVGQDLYDQPVISPTEPIADTYPREYLGKEGLQYYRFSYAYRRKLTEEWNLHFGAGIITGGRFREIIILHDPQGPIRLSPETTFGGFSTEIWFVRRLASHIAIKSGAAVDFNFETTIFLPGVQFVIDF